MELPEPVAYPSLIKAVHTGKLSESELDDAVARVLTAKFNAGVFEHPLVDAGRQLVKSALPIMQSWHARLPTRRLFY